jgi:hypothetical protein
MSDKPANPWDEEGNWLEDGWTRFELWFWPVALVVVFFGLLLGVLK